MASQKFKHEHTLTVILPVIPLHLHLCGWTGSLFWVPNKRVLIWFGPVLWKHCWPFTAVRMAADWVQRSPQSKLFLKPLQQHPLLCRQKENNYGIFMTCNTFSTVSTVYLWQDRVTVYCFPICTTFYSYSTSQKHRTSWYSSTLSLMKVKLIK